FTRMEARTGLTFTFDEYTDYAKWQAAKQKMFETGELPDVLFKAALTTDEQLRYSESGQLIDLAPLLEENAPNLWALLQAHPDWRDSITLPDGKIVALPALNEMPGQNAMWINKTWLDKLKLDVPTDAQSLRAVLEAFKTGDPNQNGKADEIPLSYLGVWDIKFLSHAFGLVANDYNIYVDETGAVQFLPAQQGFRELVEYLAGLYRDGLLDPQGFYTSDSLRTVTDSDAAATYGVFFGPNPMNLLTFDLSKQYVMLEPLSYNGSQIYRDLLGCVTRGTFAITSACADPAALLRWVDVLYGAEGAAEALAGTEGVDYEVDEDGSWSYAGGEEKMTSTVLYSLSIYDSGDMPWLFPLEFYSRYAMDTLRDINQSLMKLQTLVVKPFPDYVLTDEQRAEIAPLQSALATTVDESMGRFILGQVELSDETWSAFQQSLTGADELTAFWQKIYDGLQK
ncbi:MAG: extracellular solute-binding protein, partial [Eubacteriales bacterium]|nr:extracellular solute-binding protein [Eubacteriales bacterium]